jgi:carbon monoxide dehydrogenase subunit G
MKLKHSFTVPTDVEQAWDLLLDIERIAPCMPGAAVETVDGDDFTGTVKVRLGPIGLTYKGKASFIEKDASGHRAVIDAQGKDARGNGTARARITATLTARGSNGTAVDVLTDLNITGKPAQFGRGVMVDVGNKLIGQFAECLAGKLTGPVQSEPAAVGAGSVSGAGSGEGARAAEQAAAVESVAAGSPETVPVTAPEPYLTDSPLPDPVVADSGPLAPAVADPDLEPDPVPQAAVTGTAPEAVVAVPGTTLDQGSVEPDAAAEQAPPAQQLAESGAANGYRLAEPARPLATEPPRSSQRPRPDEVEPIDLLGSAGPALAKRLAPVLAGALLVALLVLRRRRVG